MTPRDWPPPQRLFETTRQATERYPSDVGAWYRLGEALTHVGGASAAASLSDMLAAFDRAIALDPTFAPAYAHAIGHSLQLDRVSKAREYIDAYMRLDATGPAADAIGLLRALLDPARAQSRKWRTSSIRSRTRP